MLSACSTFYSVFMSYDDLQRGQQQLETAKQRLVHTGSEGSGHHCCEQAFEVHTPITTIVSLLADLKQRRLA